MKSEKKVKCKDCANKVSCNWYLPNWQCPLGVEAKPANDNLVFCLIGSIEFFNVEGINHPVKFSTLVPVTEGNQKFCNTVKSSFDRTSGFKNVILPAEEVFR